MEGHFSGRLCEVLKRGRVDDPDPAVRHLDPALCFHLPEDAIDDLAI